MYLHATHLDFRFRTIMSKYQWIFIKLAMCIDIMEICFGIANEQSSLIFDRVNIGRVLSFQVFITNVYI